MVNSVTRLISTWTMIAMDALVDTLGLVTYYIFRYAYVILLVCSRQGSHTIGRVYLFIRERPMPKGHGQAYACFVWESFLHPAFSVILLHRALVVLEFGIV